MDRMRARKKQAPVKYRMGMDPIEFWCFVAAMGLIPFVVLGLALIGLVR